MRERVVLVMSAHETDQQTVSSVVGQRNDAIFVAADVRYDTIVPENARVSKIGYYRIVRIRGVAGDGLREPRDWRDSTLRT